MNRTIAFTLIEVDNSDAGMIGTILHYYREDSEQNNEIIRETVEEALRQHFDSDVSSIRFLYDLNFMSAENGPPIDMFVSLTDGTTYCVEVHHTWIHETFTYKTKV